MSEVGQQNVTQRREEKQAKYFFDLHCEIFHQLGFEFKRLAPWRLGVR
jgi:hypothetical protein